MVIGKKYRLLGDFTNKNAGFCTWCFADYNGREYFIKQFQKPKWLQEEPGLSLEKKSRNKIICDGFFQRKKELYSALARCRTGNNVINVDFFREGTKYYAVTDKIVSAGTDPAIIAALDPARKQALIRALLYSVAALHREGIVHSDLKPENILLKKTTNGYYAPKIIDFDGSFLSKDGPKKGEMNFDFLYVSPEVNYHEHEKKGNDGKFPITEKADIFALGILIHEYWTGSRPAIDKEYDSVASAALDKGTIRLKDSLLTPIMSELIRAMLAVDPSDRPSALEALESISGRNAPGTVPKPAPEPEPPEDDVWKSPSGFD